MTILTFLAGVAFWGYYHYDKKRKQRHMDSLKNQQKQKHYQQYIKDDKDFDLSDYDDLFGEPTTTKPNYMDKEAKRIEELSPNYYRLTNYTDFSNMLTDNSVNNFGDVYLAPNSDGLVYGAVTTLNRNLLMGRTQAIREGLFQRDDDDRQQTYVPGFEHLNDDFVQSTDGKNYALWHRTHCLPFRFCLLDGRIDGLMFAGTAHLNHGDRPNLNYFVDKYEAKRRDDYLFSRYYQNGRIHPVKLLTLKDINVPNAPQGTHLSLDDMERLASRIINFHKDGHVFKYGVACRYIGHEIIPSAVNVVLVDTTEKRVVLEAMLPNAK